MARRSRRERGLKRERSHRDLEHAEVSLEEASGARKEQETLRKNEREDLAARLDRLAGSDSNHLGRLVLQALTERFGGSA